MARKNKKKEPVPVDKKIEKLIEIYKDAEKKLIEIIANKEIKGNATTFYKEMLNQVQQEILRLQIYNTQWATEITKQLYEQAYKEAIEMLEISQESLTQLHKDAIDVIADNTINNLNQATNLVGRQLEDSIRQIGLSSTATKFATGQTLRQMQKQLAIKLLDEGLTSIKDKRGRNISISAYSEMLARSIVAETQNTCVKNIMKEHNRDLVKMTEHYTSCPLCATYEGRVYSISGTDSRFPSLQSIPGFRDGYNNIHPRCRHRLTPYIEKYQNVNKDKEYNNRPFEVDKEKEKSVNQYFKEQREKARLRNDRKQYEKYKQVLGEEAPKNFASFRNIKYNYSKRYEDIKNKFKEEFIKCDFEKISLFYRKCSNIQTRLWYKWHDENIPNLIDKTKDIETQARQAHNLRNIYRTQARELMKDQEERKKLDRDKPNIEFEDLIKSKMIRKGLTREEAIKDIFKTATKTNQEVNKSLGLE